MFCIAYVDKNIALKRGSIIHCCETLCNGGAGAKYDCKNIVGSGRGVDVIELFVVDIRSC